VATNETMLTIIGNLTDNPELRFTPSGVALTRFTVASTPRLYDQTASQWRDGEPLFMTCSAWRDMAENIAESLSKGARVVVTGKLRLSRWETPEGAGPHGGVQNRGIQRHRRLPGLRTVVLHLHRGRG